MTWLRLLRACTTELRRLKNCSKAKNSVKDVQAMRLLASFMLGVLSVAPLAWGADPDADPFAEGSVWVGDFQLVGKDTPVQKWALTVTERKGGTFKGEIIGKNMNGEVETIQFAGTAPAKDAGAVLIKTEMKGFGQVQLRGKLANGEVALIFTGTNKLGKPGAGTATLKPKN